MRAISELNVNEGGRPIKRPAPSQVVINEFQSQFGVTLPESYLVLLRHSNGGHPELDSIRPIGKPESTQWAVNTFYFLDTDKQSNMSLWAATEQWQRVLGKNAIPFAMDGGGNQFFLDFKTSPPAVKICVHDENFNIEDIAPSFEAFIGALSVDPDMI